MKKLMKRGEYILSPAPKFLINDFVRYQRPKIDSTVKFGQITNINYSIKGGLTYSINGSTILEGDISCRMVEEKS